MLPPRHFIIAAGLGFAMMAMAPFSAFAATLYFLPNTQTVSVGQTFTVAVDASSIDQAMNAASGDISFPSDKLRVLSVSNLHSTMTLWVQNPSFSNAATGGDVSFAGIVLNPGFTGTGAEIFTIRFQAVATGEADLHFSTGAVLANDGKGTNILTSMGTAAFTVIPATSAASAPASATGSGTATSSAPAASTTPAASVTTIETTSTPPTFGTGWLSETLSLLFSWGLIILLSLILLALIIALTYYIVYRLRRLRLSLASELEHERKELRDEERRAEQVPTPKREEHDPNFTLDLRPPGSRKDRGHS